MRGNFNFKISSNNVVLNKKCNDFLSGEYDTNCDKEKFINCAKFGQEIVEVLSQINIDDCTLISAFFADFLKNNLIKIETLGEHFGQEIVNILNLLLPLDKLNLINKSSEIDNIRNMLVAIAKDIRVIMIKLAQVLCTARRRDMLGDEDECKLQNEIKEVYAPLSARLGLSFIKSELQDINFRYFDKEGYEKLFNEVQKLYNERTEQIKITTDKIIDVAKKLKIKCEVMGRVKHISSIYKKMMEKNKNLSNIYDITAVRVIVNNLNDCYAMLSAVYSIYKPIDSTFKDYIARPKPNGYQSLHTTIIADNQEPLEIQIRTKEMHNYAEYGIAAHWLYKEKKSKKSLFDEKLTWIRKIIENPDQLTNEQFIDELKTDIYSGEIFVQTPQAKIIQLVENSTPLDFAYAIHSDIGNKCVGAKVNGKMAPLACSLNNGDVVEIITSSTSKGPSRDWLKIVKTSGAKSKIRMFYKKEMKEDNIKRGKSMLEQAAKVKDVALSKLMIPEWLEDVYSKYSFKDLDDMYASIGYGGVSSTQILNRLLSLYKIETINAKTVVQTGDRKPQGDSIIVSELDNMLVRFAQCCSPIPEDDIVGFVSRAKGVTIHTKSCPNLKNLSKERLVEAKWGNEKANKFVVNIIIESKNEPGILAAITRKIADLNYNIVNITSSTNNKLKTKIKLSIEVSSLAQVETICNTIKSLPNIFDAYRDRGNM